MIHQENQPQHDPTETEQALALEIEQLRPYYEKYRKEYEHTVSTLVDAGYFDKFPDDRADYPPYPPLDAQWVHYFRRAEELQRFIDSAQDELDHCEEILSGGAQ